MSPVAAGRACAAWHPADAAPNEVRKALARLRMVCEPVIGARYRQRSEVSMRLQTPAQCGRQLHCGTDGARLFFRPGWGERSHAPSRYAKRRWIICAYGNGRAIGSSPLMRHVILTTPWYLVPMQGPRCGESNAGATGSKSEQASRIKKAVRARCLLTTRRSFDARRQPCLNGRR